MANEGGAEVHGFRELVEGSAKLAALIAREIPTVFRAVAEQVGAETRVQVPRRTGALAADLGTKHDAKKAVVGYMGPIIYAGWVEFGGGYTRPYVPGGRYLFPTALDAEPQLVAAGVVATRDQIRRFRWAQPKV